MAAIHQASPPVDSLVLYKGHPARVVKVTDKIELELAGGQSKRVRAKDVELLHPGPLRQIADLVVQPGALDEAWELLAGTTTTLQELTELAFDAVTPQTVWSAWQLASAGLLFTGTPGELVARSAAEVARIADEQARKQAAERDREAFLERMRAGAPAPEDRERLVEVERLALGRSEHSRVLEALGYPQTPENAHRALVQVGYWGRDFNPHPVRCGVSTESPAIALPELVEDVGRVDLTHLAAFAIDDAGNQDPDDALSLDGVRLWVHVADVAALVAPDSELDREARTRGANLYLPDGVVGMLPWAVTEQLGLGLQARSPALSIGMTCDAEGQLDTIEIVRSWVRVERLSYEQADTRLDEVPFATIAELTERFERRRRAAGATSLDLPEVSVRVVDGAVHIRPLPALRSRELVMNAMLMAGEAVGHYCLEHDIAIPYAVQPPPEGDQSATDLAGMYARRRGFRPTRLVGEPAPHAGLGLAVYTRATSPLRRYSDLLVHQQIAAHLLGTELLTGEQIVARMGEAEVAAQAIRRAERLSNQHWKLVYLREHPQWRGEAVIVTREERRVTALIEALALEIRVRLRQEAELNARVPVSLANVDLPELTAGFRALGRAPA